MSGPDMQHLLSHTLLKQGFLYVSLEQSAQAGLASGLLLFDTLLPPSP